MDLEIMNETVITGIIDVKNFKKQMYKNLDVMKALKSSLTINKNLTSHSEEEVFQALLWEIDWRGFFISLPHYSQEKIRIKFCPITYNKKIVYEPGSITTNRERIILEEKRVDGEGLILINNLVYDVHNTIDNWLGTNIYEYPKKEWKNYVEYKL